MINIALINAAVIVWLFVGVGILIVLSMLAYTIGVEIQVYTHAKQNHPKESD